MSGNKSSQEELRIPVKVLFIAALALSLIATSRESMSLVASPSTSIAFSDSGGGKDTAQGNFIVSENILVSSDRPASPNVEPYISANPRDPKHLVASSIAYTRPDGRSILRAVSQCPISFCVSFEVIRPRAA